MAIIDVVMPQMGESIAEGTITKWYKKIGEQIGKDETLLEISTDKVDSEIPSPVSGIIAELLFAEQKTVPVHTVIARVETGQSLIAVPVSHLSHTAAPEIKSEECAAVPSSSARENFNSENSGGEKFYSPLVMNIARSEGIVFSEIDKIHGTGAGGRVSKIDILAFVQQKKSAAGPPHTVHPITERGSGIIAMDTMRRSIAEHMVRSIHTSAHVSSVTEADVTGLAALRENQKLQFEKREGFKLTFTPFFVEAVMRALREFPLLNSSVDGDSIILHKDINIGVAVALENGLIVPVIKRVQEKNIIGIARAVNDLSIRARQKKLIPEDVRGGTFTVTNPGVFGSLYGTPIINQPQVAILGIGVIKKRPVVVNDAIAIRSMVYISMSYDHRIIDGMTGGMFMEKVVSYLRQYDPALVLT